MRSALSSLLLSFLLGATSPLAWSAEGSAKGKGPTIRVEAMVGEAVVVFEDIDCPEGEVVRVPTGEFAQTNPATCETVVALSNVDDRVNDVVWAIAAADMDDPAQLAAVEAQLASLTTAEQAMVIAVLNNNARHLGTNQDTVVATVAAIVRVNPDAAATIVLTATVLAPSMAEVIVEAATEAAPEQAENIQEASDSAGEINREFQDNQAPLSGPVTSEDGEGGAEDPDVEVTSITEAEPPPAVRPPIDTSVPPGGALPAAPSGE